MRKIPVFKAERDANLTQQIQANCSVAYAAPVFLAKDVSPISEAKIQKLIAAKGKESLDLFPLDCIMVSTGWNLNDDVFDVAETWAARETPEDKPLNYEHKCNDIIGHIVSSCPVDEDYVVIESQNKDGVVTAVEDLPPKFHILASSVLYKIWSDEKLQERMDKILAEIPEHKWFVSMEALFSNFDYAMITPSGQQIVVARNKETAFLTKHLRAYKDETTGKYGSGYYEGNKIGRLIRNFTFSGKGLVLKPANPESVIFASQPTEFAGKTFASYEQIFDNSKTVGYINNVSGSNQPKQESDKMSVTVEQLQAELASAKKQIDSVVAENATLKNETTDKLKAQVTSLNTDVKTRDEQLVVKANEVAELTKKLDASAKDAAAIKAELDKANVELAKVKAAELETNRISSLVSAGVDKVEAKELFDMTSAMSDEQFTKYVAKTKAAKEAAAKAAPVVPVVKAEETTPAPKVEDLNNVTPSNEPALATSGVDSNKTNNVRMNISAAFKASKGLPVTTTEKK